MPTDLPTTHQDRFLTVVAGEPVIFHCHHYNAALQQVIEDASGSIPTDDLLRDVAAVVVHHQMTEAFKDRAQADRLALAAEYFREAGFGRLDLTRAGADGGTVRLDDSHYGHGFRARKDWGARKTPGCHFAAGFVAGALAAAFDLPPASFRAIETACVIEGKDHCTIEVTRATEPRDLTAPLGPGDVPETLPERPKSPRETPVDEAAILSALSKLPLVGNEEGVLPAFDVYLSRHYANYYNGISFEFERLLTESNPALADAAAEVLIEAGHQCAFNTFGGIMKSPEWDAVVGPMLASHADWVFGMTAAVNALGWGRWTVTDLVEGERLVMRVDASYEANGYVSHYGVGDRPRCYLATGAAAGIMNLLFVGDITQKPTLDFAYYAKLFSGEGTFRGVEHKCRAKGDDCCEIEVTRLDK